jgi:hypothetical protein
VLLLVTDAKVDRLIPLYAVGVFTSFTMSQAGMARHHLRKKEPGWRKGIFVNAVGAVLSAVVDIIILITKFTHGAWVIVVIVPVMVYGLTRLNKQYEAEAHELERDAPRAAEARILRRHMVFVLIENLDVASARAIQYARTLTPDELRAIHFDLDPIRTEDLVETWGRLGLTRPTIEIVECPDRRMDRATAELVAQALIDGETEVSVLLPRRHYTRLWHRLLHDRTADRIATALSGLPHCNVTFVPYHLGAGTEIDASGLVHEKAKRREHERRDAKVAANATKVDPSEFPAARSSIASVSHRERVLVAGKVHTMRVQPWGGVPSLECTIVDESGSIVLVFMGRRSIAGLKTGTKLTASGVVGEHHGRPAILNPVYEILSQTFSH